MKKIIFLIFLLCSAAVQAEVRLRPSKWAVPVIGSSLQNFYALDSKIYRSEQPDSKAFAELEKFGIQEVLNLRQFHTDNDEAEKTDIKLHHVKMNTDDIKVEQLVQALKIIKNSKGPVLIHCWHGSDRTGIVSASYRIILQNWSKDHAIEELKDGGYGYHAKIYPNIIEMLNSLDVQAIKAELGLLQTPF
ncbi:MAG: dual specificity protein phosphatase family protein [Candidatus Electrothrix sp. YB6]